MLKPHDVLAMIQEYEVKVVELRFTDINGKEHHVSFPAKCIDEDIFCFVSSECIREFAQLLQQYFL